MENIWIPKYDMPMIILPSLTDSSGKLSVPDCFSLFMDVAAVHAPMLKCGTEDLAKQGLFWLTVRSKIKIIRRPRKNSRKPDATGIIPSPKMESRWFWEKHYGLF